MPTWVFHNIRKSNPYTNAPKLDAQFLNTTTAVFSTLLLKKLLDKELLSKKSSEFLFKMMADTAVGQNRIKGKLPKGTGGAYTGSSFTNDVGLTGAINDIGIVKLPNGNHFAVAIFVYNTTEKFEDGEEIIADITKVISDYYSIK